MSRRILLIIAYHFPPDNAIGGLRPHRFFKYLKRLGYECHVLTAAPRKDVDDPDIEYIPDPLREGKKQGLAWQAERVIWKFLVRGQALLSWTDALFAAGSAFLEAHKDDAVTILSSAPPLGVHIAARRLSKAFGCPWIADFRDPIDSPGGDRAVFQDFAAPRVERHFLNRAGLVLANTDAMRDRWVTLYPELRDKIHLMWNGFDPEDAIVPPALPAREQKLLIHTGELYGGRDIRPVLYSIGRLTASGKVPAASIQVMQVGPTEPGEIPDAAFLAAAGAQVWLEFRDAVPSAQARAMALNSDGLLLIQPHTAVQVPGKLFEYLRMGRPILAYVIPESPVERILAQAGVPYECIYPGQAEAEIDARVGRFIARLDGRVCQAGAWFEETFEASRQAAALDRLIRSLHGA